MFGHPPLSEQSPSPTMSTLTPAQVSEVMTSITSMAISWLEAQGTINNAPDLVAKNQVRLSHFYNLSWTSHQISDAHI